MEDNKILDLLEKIYAEFQEVKTEDKSLKEDITTLEEDIPSLKNDVNKIEMKIDEKLSPITIAILDAQKRNTELISRMNNKLDNIEINLNKANIEMQNNNDMLIELINDINNGKV